MFPFAYPPDAITVGYSDNTAGASTTIVSIPEGETYTILGFSAGSRTSQAVNSFLTCYDPSGNVVTHFTRTGGSSFELVTIKCNYNIDLVIGGGTPGVGALNYGNIVYVPYDIDMAEVSTTTPYTEHCDLYGSSQYCYSSKDTAIIYFLSAITFILACAIFLGFFMNMFTKRRKPF